MGRFWVAWEGDGWRSSGIMCWDLMETVLGCAFVCWIEKEDILVESRIAYSWIKRLRWAVNMLEFWHLPPACVPFKERLTMIQLPAEHDILIVIQELETDSIQ